MNGERVPVDARREAVGGSPAEMRSLAATVCPGAVLTPLAEKTTTPDYRAYITKRLIPLGRVCTPDDIAHTVDRGPTGRARGSRNEVQT